MGISKLVGLSGISGAGKTFMLMELMKELPPGTASVLSFDNYYRPITEQKKDSNGIENFDLPEGVDHERFLRDLELLKSGYTVSLKQYGFNNPQATPMELIIHPAPLLIIEGIFIYHFPAISNQLDLKLFIELPDEITLARRIQRDKEERGYPENATVYQWQHHVLPGYREYVLPHKADADMVIDNSKETSFNINLMKNSVLALLDKKI